MQPTQTLTVLTFRTHEEGQSIFNLFFPPVSHQHQFETLESVLDFISSLLILSWCLQQKNRDHLTLRDIGVATRFPLVQSFGAGRVSLLRVHCTLDCNRVITF